MPLFRTTLALALVLSTASVFAADMPQSASGILQAQRELRTKLDNPTGEYSRFPTDAVARMKQAQDRIFRLLDGVTSVDQLDDAKKADLSSALDEVKAVLADNAGSRLVCRREARMGTNITEKRCETIADREARARQSQQDVSNMAGRGKYSEGH